MDTTKRSSCGIHCLGLSNWLQLDVVLSFLYDWSSMPWEWRDMSNLWQIMRWIPSSPWEHVFIIRHQDHGYPSLPPLPRTPQPLIHIFNDTSQIVILAAVQWAAGSLTSFLIAEAEFFLGEKHFQSRITLPVKTNVHCRFLHSGQFLIFFVSPPRRHIRYCIWTSNQSSAFVQIREAICFLFNLRVAFPALISSHLPSFINFSSNNFFISALYSTTSSTQ